MRKKLLILTFSITLISITVGSVYNNAHTNPTGSPNARTGSPGDGGNTCAISGCHTGFTVTTKQNVITSNIPAEGYTPGTKYTITATSNSIPSRNVFGFQISPQSTTGTLLGTVTITNATATQVTGGGKYVTHKQAGITGSNGVKTWSFDWTAPAAGTGTVTFYGCFNNANGNGGTTGDSIIKSTLVVQENLSNGIANDQLSKLGLTVFPNPATERIAIKNDKNITYNKVVIMDLSGKLIYTSDITESINLLELGMQTGVYFISIYNNDELLGTSKLLMK